MLIIKLQLFLNSNYQPTKLTCFFTKPQKIWLNEKRKNTVPAFPRFQHFQNLRSPKFENQEKTSSYFF